MSTLNLELQCVGIMRKAGSELFEKEMTPCNNMKASRKIAEKRKQFKNNLLDSVEPVKILLTWMFQSLQLKEKNISCLVSATDAEIAEVRELLKSIDGKCTDDPQVLKTKSAISDKPLLQQFAVEKGITFLKLRNVAVLIVYVSQSGLI